jgi:hypothetical protein
MASMVKAEVLFIWLTMELENKSQEKKSKRPMESMLSLTPDRLDKITKKANAKKIQTNNKDKEPSSPV